MQQAKGKLDWSELPHRIDVGIAPAGFTSWQRVVFALVAVGSLGFWVGLAFVVWLRF